MKKKRGIFYTYQGAKVETNCGEIAGQHSEEIKSVSKPVDVTAQCLLTIPISYFCLKNGDLVEADITSFTNLYIFMMSDFAIT